MIRFNAPIRLPLCLCYAGYSSGSGTCGNSSGFYAGVRSRQGRHSNLSWRGADHNFGGCEQSFTIRTRQKRLPVCPYSPERYRCGRSDQSIFRSDRVYPDCLWSGADNGQYPLYASARPAPRATNSPLTSVFSQNCYAGIDPACWGYFHANYSKSLRWMRRGSHRGRGTCARALRSDCAGHDERGQCRHSRGYEFLWIAGGHGCERCGSRSINHQTRFGWAYQNRRGQHSGGGIADHAVVAYDQPGQYPNTGRAIRFDTSAKSVSSGQRTPYTNRGVRTAAQREVRGMA